MLSYDTIFFISRHKQIQQQLLIDGYDGGAGGGGGGGGGEYG